VDSEVLEEALSERAGRRVAIEIPKRGDRKKLLDQARRNAEEAASDPGFLFALADEVARTRRAELVRAYRAVVGVMPGFGNTRATSRRPAADDARPCVIFVVRRKRAMPSGHAQHLPRWLVTYADRGGRRLPFALPTDVQDAREHNASRLHADSELSTQRHGFRASYGHFAALVQVDGDASTYMMSAMHVLSPDPDAAMARPQALAVLPVDVTGHVLATQPPLAIGQPLGGRLVPDAGDGQEPSFDVQLARVEDSQLDAVESLCPLRGIHPTQASAADASDLACLAARSNRFELLRADNNRFGAPAGTIVLRWSGVYPDQDMPSDFGENLAEVERFIFQRDLLRFDAVDGSPAPMPGDSGSAIVRRGEEGRVTLVAMHIAGDRQGASIAIPAWSLFDTKLWTFPPAAALSLLDPG